MRNSMRKKVIIGLLTVLIMTSLYSISSFAAEGSWKSNAIGTWYEYSDGSYPANEWAFIDNEWYWFDQNGYAVKGWRMISGKWYYFDTDFTMVTGFRGIKNSAGIKEYYYFSDSGHAVTGWVLIKDEWHYFGSNCAMVTGYQAIPTESGVKYYIFDDDGVMLTGWQKINDTDWRYFYLSGSNKGAMQSDYSYQNNSIKGIDVSVWQGKIDWQKVKDFGIEFAFVRLGYGNKNLDIRFAENMKGANEVGIKTGVYYYSTAMTPEEALRDAQFVIDNMDGYTVSYPVAIDLEDTSQSVKLTKAEITELARVFCDEIRKAGYTPMIYCNENWYKNYIDFSSVGDVERWIAKYGGSYNDDISRDVWQAGATSVIDGITENVVDIDFAFTDYSDVVTPRTTADKNYVKSRGVWRWNEIGMWYSYLAGGYPANQWLEIDGVMYWFNEAGYEDTPSGWQLINKEWYYFNSYGNAHSGWLNLGGKWYYTEKSGKMTTGWKNISGIWYYFGDSKDGVMKTGWQYISGAWYYFGKTNDGKMYTGWQNIGGKWYYLGKAGDGSMKTGWQYIDNKVYYLGSTGDGVMKTGWQYISGEWYYFDYSGVMKTGWQQINNKWYYLNNDGIMAYDTWIDNYYVDKNGVWVQ